MCTKANLIRFNEWTSYWNFCAIRYEGASWYKIRGASWYIYKRNEKFI